MSEVRKGTSRNTENENKRCKIFNKVLNMNRDYVRGKKKQKENMLIIYVIQLSDRVYNVTFPI
jgi:hypothetical protein